MKNSSIGGEKRRSALVNMESWSRGEKRGGGEKRRRAPKLKKYQRLTLATRPEVEKYQRLTLQMCRHAKMKT